MDVSCSLFKKGELNNEEMADKELFFLRREIPAVQVFFVEKGVENLTPCLNNVKRRKL